MPPPVPRSADRRGVPAPTRPAEGEAAVAYDVQPTVVVVLVVALALLIVITVVAVVALGPSTRTVADGPLQPATSAARPPPESIPEPAQAGGGTSSAPTSSLADASTTTAASSPAGAGAAGPTGNGAGGAGQPGARPGGGAAAATSGAAASGSTGTPAGGATSGGGVNPAGASGSGSSAAANGSASSLPPIPLAPPPPSASAGPALPSAGPVDLDAVPGQNTAVVRWAVGGPAAELGGFQIQWNGGGRTIDQQVGPEARKAQVDGLAPATGYSVAITPLSREGRPNPDAAQSIAVTTLPTSLPPPGAPADLAVAAGPGSLTVSWTADPGDRATTQFYVSWGCCTGFLGGLSVDREVRSYTITGLAPGVAHTVEVQALGPNLDAELATKRAVSGTPG